MFSRLPVHAIKVQKWRSSKIKNWLQGLSEWSPFCVECCLFFGAHGSTFWPNMSQDLAAQTQRFAEQLDPLNLYASCLTTLTSSSLTLHCSTGGLRHTALWRHTQELPLNFINLSFNSTNQLIFLCLVNTKKINTAKWLPSIIFLVKLMTFKGYFYLKPDQLLGVRSK